MKKIDARAAVAAGIVAAALAAPVPWAAAEEPPDEAALEAQLEAAFIALDRLGAEIRACGEAVGLSIPWGDEDAEMEPAEAALWDRIDALCAAGQRDEAEAVFRGEMLAQQGVTPAQYEEAQACAMTATLRMRETYVEIFGEEGLPPMDEQDMHVCGG